jgi:NAD(P)-dependent dehydrogenase (short-subunit alcohol dehydrogenase family)
MLKRLDAKAVVVTGAGTQGAGIGNGKASAIVYAREGAKVLAVDIDFEAAKETASRIRSEGGACEPWAADVSKSVDCENAIEACIQRFGRIDVLHNNVGITNSGGPIEYDEEDWDRMMNVNVKSMFLTAKYALPHMERQRSGSIINIGSINAVRAIPFPKAAYAASKAAVIGLSREIAIQYASKGIRCNVVLVGLVKTPIVENNNVKLYGGDVEEMWRMRDRMSPTGKQGESWDVANTCLFLATDESKYINGVVLPVDGGLINIVRL